MKNLLFTILFLSLSILAYGQNCGDIYGLQVQFEDFESYNLGAITPQSDKWQLWFANSDDAFITGSGSGIGSNLVLNVESTDTTNPDVLYLLGDSTSGKYRLSWRMFIVQDGYYNIQHTQNPRAGANWAFHSFFTNNEGKVYIGGTNLNGPPDTTFSYNQGAWNDIVHIIDLDNDKAELWVNNTFVYSWTFSRGLPGNSNGLGAIDFFANTSTHFQIDDICFKSIDCATVICSDDVDPVCVNDQIFTNECEASCAGYTSNEWTTVNCQFPGNDVIFDVEDNICDLPGEHITIPVRVTNFNNILLFSQSISISNSQVARFDSLQPIINVIAGSKSINRVNDTLVTIAWGGSQATDINNGSVLLELNIELIGNPNDSADIIIQNTPTNIEVIDGTGNFIAHQEFPGSICIEENLASIQGKIHLPDGRPIGKVVVPLAKDANQTLLEKQITASDGLYEFTNYIINTDYTIEPRIETSTSVLDGTGVLNGVDGRDQLSLLRHISGATVLTTARQAIAADVNRDGIINLIDGAQIFLLVGGAIPQFAGNKSWCFIPTDEFNLLDFSTALQHAYSTSKTYDPLDASKIDQDFIGVKVGDITNDVNPANFGSNVALSRNLASAELILTPFVINNQTISIDLLANGFQGVSGFQFSINWDTTKFSFTEINNFSPLVDNLEGSYFLNRVTDGALTCVWVNDPAINLDSQTVLTTFSFDVIGEIGETDSIRITGSPTKLLVFDTDLNDIEVTVTHSFLEVISAANDLSKNYKLEVAPNPSNGLFKWNFDDKLVEPLELIIYDSFGRQIKSESLSRSSYHSGTLDLSNYAPSVYWFSVKGKNILFSKKLVFLK